MNYLAGSTADEASTRERNKHYSERHGARHLQRKETSDAASGVVGTTSTGIRNKRYNELLGRPEADEENN
jgi:hypothetical protein